MDFKNRVRRLQTLMRSHKLGALLATSPTDILYYTGYPAKSGFLLIGPSRPKLFLSPVENEAAKLKGAEVVLTKETKDLIRELKRYKILGYDEHNLSADLFTRLKRARLRLKPASSVIKKPRGIKETEEIELIKGAIKITKRVFAGLKLAGSETKIARQIELKIVGAGARSAFDSIVAAGPNSYFIHHTPTNRKVKKEDLVIVDMGAKFKGYCSDLTRTFCQKPGQKQKQLIRDVQEIKLEVLDKIRPGVAFKELQKVYENLMKKKGYNTMHGIGHGIGLDVHEQAEGKLAAGMVFAIEPGIYIKGFGGCRFEDMVLVKNNKGKLLSL